MKLLNVNPQTVRNKLLVMLVALINKFDAAEPVIVPCADAVGKVVAPLSVNVFPFIFIIPFVWVKAPPTVKEVPRFKVLTPAAALFNVKLFSVCEPLVINKLSVMVVEFKIKFDVADPLMVPFGDKANVVAPLRVKENPFKFKIPAVWTNAPDIDKLFPNFKVCPVLLSVKLFNV